MKLLRVLAAVAVLAVLLAGPRCAAQATGAPLDPASPSSTVPPPPTTTSTSTTSTSTAPTAPASPAEGGPPTDPAIDAPIVESSTVDTPINKAASTMAAANAASAELPGPTIPYDRRGEYRGFEYNGPVRVPRHVVLDTHAKCGGFGNPASFYSFDQRGYSFRGLGAFSMFRLPNLTEEVQILEARSPLPQAVSRIVGAAIHGNNHTVEVLVSLKNPGNPTDGFWPVVLVDGVDSTQFALGSDFYKAADGAIEMSRDGVFGTAKPLVLAAKVAGASGTTMAVTFEVVNGVPHLNVFVEVSGSHLQKTRGLCGNFNFDSGDDLVLVPDPSGSGAVLGSASGTGHRWAIRDATLALFRNYTVPEAVSVVDAALEPADLSATAPMVADAQTACNSVKKDFKLPCIMNTLLAGRAGQAEVLSTQDVLLENSILVTPNLTACLENFFITPWGPFGQCDAACGPGRINRTRHVYDGESRLECGRMTQFRKCSTPCEHVKLSGKCAVFGDPHIVTFDQVMYDYRGTGEYVLYHSLDDREQVNLVFDRLPGNNRTAGVSWVTGAAFRVGPDVISAHMPDASDDLVLFRYNGRLLGGLSGDVAYYGLFTVRKSGVIRGGPNNNLIVEVTAPGGTTVTWVFYRTWAAPFMNIFLTVGGERIAQTQGLCGSYDFKPENDLTNDKGSKVDSTSFGWSWAVDSNRTLFGDPVPQVQMPPSKLPVSARLIGFADGSYGRAVNACVAVPPVLRDACVLDMVTLGPQAFRMAQDVSSVVEGSRITVEYVAQGCLVAEGSFLGPWEDWSECSRACNGGTATRKRSVFAYTGEECSTVAESRDCNTHPCPVDCEVGPWRDWAPCSVTCGNGTEMRERGVLIMTAFGGMECPVLSESRPCVRLPCCVVGNWTEWNDCQSDGTQERTRYVSEPSRCGAVKEKRECCYAEPWPVSQTKFASNASAPGLGGEPLWSECRNGEQVRRRRVVPEHCAADEERRPCCESGDWSDWGSCQDGVETRWRTVVPENCTHNTEHRVCCMRYAWSGWSECDNGTRNRTREVLPLGCDKTHEREACCHFGDWKNATQCEMGFQTLRRDVDPPACGKAVMQVECCSAGEWGPWGRCRRNGTRTRHREVYGRDGCVPSTQTEKCTPPKKKEKCEILPHCVRCPCAPLVTPEITESGRNTGRFFVGGPSFGSGPSVVLKGKRVVPMIDDSSATAASCGCVSCPCTTTEPVSADLNAGPAGSQQEVRAKTVPSGTLPKVN